MASMDIRFACRTLERTLAGMSQPDRSLSLHLANDASWFVGDRGRRVDLGRRGALRRILVAMCKQHDEEPGRALGVSALVEVGWPGERVLVDAAATRVRVAVSTLRRLGLKAIILTRDDGYLVHPSVRIERTPRG
jgi:hypothetical protein